MIWSNELRLLLFYLFPSPSILNLSMLQTKTLATSFSYTRSEFRKSIFSLTYINIKLQKKPVHLSNYTQFQLEPGQPSELVAYSSALNDLSAPVVSTNTKNAHSLPKWICWCRGLPLYTAERSQCSAKQVLSMFIPVFVCAGEHILQPHLVWGNNIRTWGISRRPT